MSERDGQTRVEDDALRALRLLRELRQAGKGDEELDPVQQNLEWYANSRARKARKRAIHNAEVDVLDVDVQGMTEAEQIAWAKGQPPELVHAARGHLKPEVQRKMIEEREEEIIARAESKRERQLAAKNKKKTPESWLAEQLCDGRQIKAVLLIELAKKAGYSKPTLDRAKEKLGAMSRREGFGRGAVWYWYLPKSNKSRRKTP